MISSGWLISIALLALSGAAIVIPRLYGTITRRSPWSAAFLQRVEATLAHWSDVLARDWAQLLGRVRHISQDADGEHNAQRFVLGMLAMLIGPVVVVLNAVILAQILEVFLPGSAEMLTIPYLGDFMPFPFIAAVIIAGVEIIAAVAFWHAPHLAWRVIAGSVALVAIVAETAGGYIRARVLEGADDLALAGSSGLLGVQTAWVSALLSFLAPMAEMIAGVLFFEGVLAPLGHHGLRVLRIIPLWLLRGGGFLLYGPFLREPFLTEPACAVETPLEETAMPEEASQPQPLIHDSVLAAERVTRGMVDAAITLKTETHALAAALAGLSGAITAFLATKLKHGPRHTVEVQPGAVVDEFSTILAETRSQPVFQDCQMMAHVVAPRDPALIYRSYSRDMLLEEAAVLERKRTRLGLLVRQMARQACELAIAQLARIRQTDVLFWSQDPEAQSEWEGIQALQHTLEGQAQQVERSLLHAITQRQETLQGLNDFVASPLLAEMRDRSHAENLRQIKIIVTRLGCDPAREGFPLLAALFANTSVETSTPVLPAITAGEAGKALHGRMAARVLLEEALAEMATCHARLEQAGRRMHEVTDHLVEVRCLDCPDSLCSVCTRCEHLQLTIHAQANEVDEDCAGFERLLTVRIEQLQRLAKRKTLWGRLFAWLDSDDVKNTWQEVQR